MCLALCTLQTLTPIFRCLNNRLLCVTKKRIIVYCLLKIVMSHQGLVFFFFFLYSLFLMVFK